MKFPSFLKIQFFVALFLTPALVRAGFEKVDPYDVIVFKESEPSGSEYIVATVHGKVFLHEKALWNSRYTAITVGLVSAKILQAQHDRFYVLLNQSPKREGPDLIKTGGYLVDLEDFVLLTNERLPKKPSVLDEELKNLEDEGAKRSLSNEELTQMVLGLQSKTKALEERIKTLEK
jgi:hypothetical protein